MIDGNLKLMYMYRGDIIKEINDIQDKINKDRGEIYTTKLNRIKELSELLLDSDKFELSFYKNILYFGVPITMNKWNKIVVSNNPEDYKTSATSLENIKRIKQGHKVEPIMTNRKLVQLVHRGGSTKGMSKYNEYMTQELDKYLGVGKSGFTPLKFGVTGRFKGKGSTQKILTNYLYSDDKLVSKDNPLLVYRGAERHDKRQHKYDSVLVPANKWRIILNKK